MRELRFRLPNDDQGQNIVEYALLLAGIVLAIVGTIYAVWSAINRIAQ